MEKVEAAPTGLDKLRLMFAMQAHRNPTFAPIARVIEAARHTDDAVAAAWKSASKERRDFCQEVLVPAVDTDGGLHRSWKSRESSEYPAQMASFRLWDDQVNLERLAPSRVLMTATCASALRAPCGET